jgi:PAS domain S-box-containing protein
VNDASGRATHLIGIVHDVTEHKRVEEKRAEDLLEAAPDAMVVVDQSGRMILANAQTERLFGYRREEILGRNVELLIPTRFHERHQAHRTTFFSQPRIRPMGANLQLSGLRKDGTEFPVEIRLSPMQTPEGILVTSAIRDISERKMAEDYRLKLATIVESSDDAIASGTLDGIIVSWNAGAQRMYGYTEAEALGKPIAILVPSELPDEENKIHEILRAGGRIEHFETIRVTKTGKRINVSLTISPIKDSSDRIVGISGIARDITERKLAEEALRASEGRLRLAQQAARIGTFERDVRTGRITWAEGLDSLYGLPPGSVDGKTPEFFRDLIHPADRERVARLIQEAFKTGQPTEGEWRAIWPDDSIHWIVSRWQVLMDDSGEPSRVVGVNMDVTERKLAEQALHAHEELLKIFVKNVPVAVAMLDHNMRYLQVSDRWCSDNSVEPSELLGRSREEIPEMPERWKEFNRRALQGETLRADEDCWESRGITRWNRWEVLPWRNPDGSVGGILVFAEDITNRKQMEEELSGMSRKLIDSQEQERARIGRELHDDINQRLAMVSVAVQGLPETPSELQRRTENIRKELHQISEDVQALSHDLHSSKMEYLGVVAGMKSWCKEFAGRHNFEIDFKSDVPSPLPRELGVSLFRVLQEALQNVVKHSGVKQVDVDLRKISDEIHLDIKDSGKGFEVDAALQGKGLGLISMRERVRLVKGTIAIDSKPMGGTRINIRVPLDKYANSRKEAV